MKTRIFCLSKKLNVPTLNGLLFVIELPLPMLFQGKIKDNQRTTNNRIIQGNKRIDFGAISRLPQLGFQHDLRWFLKRQTQCFYCLL